MKLYKKIVSIVSIIMTDNVFVYSAQASFFMIISIIPFIMLLLSLAQYILPISEASLLSAVIPFVPPALESTVTAIIDELFYKSTAPIISITAISSLWTASRGIAAIERGIRGVYHTPNRKIIGSDIVASLFYTIVFVIITLLIFVTVVFGSSIIRSLELQSTFLRFILGKTSWLKWIITFTFMTLILALLYMALSGRKIHYKRHLPGAVFTSVVWIIFSLLFSFYIENFANYSYIYGSLTTIVLLMLWLYFSMIIFLIGGEINVTILVMKLKKRNLQTEEDTEN